MTPSFFPILHLSPDVCSLRLDFESFTLAGPSVTDTVNFATNHEAFGGLCDQDLFTVDGTGGTAIPLIWLNISRP